MFIVFNFFALLQGIFLALLLGCFFKSGADDYLYAHGVTRGQLNYFFMYLVFVLLAGTELLGIRGRLFWLPSWFLAFVLLVLIGFSGTVVPGWPKWTIGLLAVASGYGMLVALDRKFRNTFYKRAGELSSLSGKLPQNNPEAQKQFFKAVKSNFVTPSKLYLYSYNLYKLLNPKTIPCREYETYTLSVLNILLLVVTDQADKIELEEAKTTLQYRLNNEGLSNSANSITDKIKGVLNTYS